MQIIRGGRLECCGWRGDDTVEKRIREDEWKGDE